MQVKTIDEYIAQYDGEVKAILEQTRAVICAAAPDTAEKLCADYTAALKAVAVENELNPAKIKWNC